MRRRSYKGLQRLLVDKFIWVAPLFGKPNSTQLQLSSGLTTNSLSALYYYRLIHRERGKNSRRPVFSSKGRFSLLKLRRSTLIWFLFNYDIKGSTVFYVIKSPLTVPFVVGIQINKQIRLFTLILKNEQWEFYIQNLNLDTFHYT